MPPRTRKRKASADTVESKAPPTKRTARAPRKSAPGLSTNTTPKGANATKKKIDVNDIKKNIQKQADDLVAFVEDELRSTPSRIDTKVINDELTSDFASVLSCITTGKGKPGQGVDEGINLKAMASLRELRGVIEEYETVNKYNLSIKKPGWVRWEQDAKDLGKLNQFAMGHATQAVSHIIMPGLHPSSIKAPENCTDIERIAWELVEDSRPRKTEETWGMAAQEQVKAFTRILRLLPGEEGAK